MTLHHAVLYIASPLVPHARRAEWFAEWQSELWYVLEQSGPDGRGSWWNREALSFSLGAFPDAAWLWRNSGSPETRPRLWLQSPSRCLWFLGALATLSAIFFVRSGPLDTFLRDSHREPGLLFARLLMIGLSLVILPATTSLALGDYPATPSSPAHIKRLRRWIFLALKFVLVLPIVFCGTLDLAPIVSASGLQAHALLISYVLAFRWALVDQRNPILVGQAAETFLQWYGTEFFCIKGHGFLHVPEISTTYHTQHWPELDASWSSLFS